MKHFLIILLTCIAGSTAFGQWTPVTALAPAPAGGSLILLSDGTVMVKTSASPGNVDSYGNTYYRLTPDINGSYVNGTWTAIAPMINTRLYYSSQVLKDGRVYVAGGEYGSGSLSAEVYDHVTNTWTAAPAPGSFISDANSEILEDGRILQAIVGGGASTTSIYNPATNTFTAGPSCFGIHNESAWLKLPDNSILFVDLNSTNSERYIPSSNTWVADATVPVTLYKEYETGGALLLPDGRAFFIGADGHNAYYSPSGSTAPGTWSAAADFPTIGSPPTAQGTPDGPAAMMVNGIVLCAASPTPTYTGDFPELTTFYEFNPVTNAFTAKLAPGGGANLNIPTYMSTFLTLPDGKVLYSQLGSNQLYVYTPAGSPIKAWRPVINTISKTGASTYQLTGYQFNGISQGATYGDDWQMNTNYPIVRLVSGTNVYYCRTYNWSSTGVKRGTATDNVTFTLPAGLPVDNYFLYVVANGIESAPVQFSTVCSSNITITGTYSNPVAQSSNWIKSSGQTTILNTADVKLDADPVAGSVEFKPAVVTDYFLAAPSTTAAVFIAQALDGCGGAVPARPAKTTPIITNTLLKGPVFPPHPARRKSIVAENNSNSDIKIYPNPGKNLVYLDLTGILPEKISVEISDANGKLVSQTTGLITVANQKSYPVKVDRLSAGIYLISVKTNACYKTGKIIVSK